MSHKFQNDMLYGKKRSKIKRGATIALIALIALPAVAVCAALVAFKIWANGVPLDASLLPTSSSLPVFYDINGDELPYASDGYIQMSEISDNLKNAFVALEDKRFYKHKGYDPIRMVGATLSNLKAGKISQGASTITQQLVKNTHLTHERTVERKLKEIAIAMKLEQKYSKNEILSMYLSVIYFGSGAYGVKNAARTFFDKDVTELTLAECATLAGIVRNPAGYSPFKAPENCLERRNTVLDVMQKQNYISASECDAAKREPLNARSPEERNGNDNIYKSDLDFYIAKVKAELAEEMNVTSYTLDNMGLKVYTCLDPELQTALGEERRNAENFGDSEGSASVVMDNSSGEVRAYVSSYPYEVRRQMGSVIKPLAVYAPALDMRCLTLATPIVDEQVDFNGFCPANFGGVYYGDTTVREAIKKSMNSVSVKVLDYIGVDASVNYLTKFGFDGKRCDRSYALALGTLDATPIEVAAAYGTFANGGYLNTAHFVRYAVKDDVKVYEAQNKPAKAISSATSALITSALVDAVRDGTARSLSTLPIKIAAKTGTVESASGLNSDAWCAGYNADCTVLVWHGSDNGMKERGGGYATHHAANIWKKLLERGKMTTDFPACADVVATEVDLYSTKCSRMAVGASQNTPSKYRKFEIFDVNNLPDVAHSKFENIPVCAFTAKRVGERVTISFDCEEIYRYTVTCKDVLGERCIYDDACDLNGVTLVDAPVSLGGKVEYTVRVSLPANPDVYSESKTTVLMI